MDLKSGKVCVLLCYYCTLYVQHGGECSVCGGCSVRKRHNVSTEEGVQCRSVTSYKGGTSSVLTKVPYGSVTPSNWQGCVDSTGLPKLLREVVDGCTCVVSLILQIFKL